MRRTEPDPTTGPARRRAQESVEETIPIHSGRTIEVNRTGKASSATLGVPPVLLQHAPTRLRAMAIVFLSVNVIMWIGVNLVERQLLLEFTRPLDWIPPTLGMLASVVLLWLCRKPKGRELALTRIGLVYQVVISATIAVSSYWEAFIQVPVEALNADTVGFSGVAMWMVAYVAIVPARPREAVIASILSGSTIPVVMWWNIRLGLAPEPGPIHFFILWVLPYILTAIMCYLLARIIYGLGQDVRRARELGSYRLEACIGRGNMGEVWRAQHGMLARPAAIKLIQPEVLAGRRPGFHDAIARFEREARLTATLESSHSVRVYDFGLDENGTLYYVMELLHGIDLETLVSTHGPIDPSRCVYILRQVCESLEEAHRRGLIHRDIKPANIYLTEWAFDHDFVKVLDFGLAKEIDAMEREPSPIVTGANTVVGTPAYLAPEVATGRSSPDARSDLYSLGCVAYWLVSGRHVFDASTPIEMIACHAREPATPPSQKMGVSVPTELEALILSCLAKDPTERPQSMGELSEQLQSLVIEPEWDAARARAWWTEHGLARA